MLGRAAPVREARRALLIDRGGERRAAARAPRGQRAERVALIPVLVDRNEQLQDGARREGQALLAIEPDQSAAVTEVEIDGASVVAVEALRRHRGLAGRTRQRPDWRRAHDRR